MGGKYLWLTSVVTHVFSASIGLAGGIRRDRPSGTFALWGKSLLLLAICLACSHTSPAIAADAFPRGWIDAVDKARFSTIEGQITEISPLPDAATNPYPDCYFTARVKANKTLSGEAIPSDIVLVLPGFYRRHVCNESRLHKGELVRAKILLFENIPARLRQVQQSDMIDSLALGYYFPVTIQKISSWSSGGVAPVLADKTPKKSDIAMVLPVDEKARQKRRKSMARDLAGLNSILAGHEGSVEQWFRDLAPLRKAYEREYKKQASKWVRGGFFSAGYADLSPIKRGNFVSVMSELNRYLRQRHIDLILVRIPSKGDVSLDLFTQLPEDGVSDPDLVTLDRDLLRAGIEVVDVQAAAVGARFRLPLMYYYQTFREGHPAEGMAWVLADRVSKRLARYACVQDTKQRFTLSKDQGPSIEAKWPAGNKLFDPSKPVEFRTVVDHAGAPVKVGEFTSSPILVIGNSFITQPNMEKGGSFPQYLAFQSGIVPDILYRPASIDMARMLVRKGPGFLAGRRVCIYPYEIGSLLGRTLGVPQAYLDRSALKPLVSYSSGSLSKLVFKPALGTPGFRLTSKGEVEARPLKGPFTAGGSIGIPLPETTPRVGRIVLELQFSQTDESVLSVRYGKETRVVRRSVLDTDAAEQIVFPACASGPASRTLTVSFEESKNPTDRSTLLRSVTACSTLAKPGP